MNGCWYERFIHEEKPFSLSDWDVISLHKKLSFHSQLFDCFTKFLIDFSGDVCKPDLPESLRKNKKEGKKLPRLTGLLI